MFLLWLTGASLAACSVLGFVAAACRGIAAGLAEPEPVQATNVVRIDKRRRPRAA
jgi:hypothetical protein